MIKAVDYIKKHWILMLLSTSAFALSIVNLTQDSIKLASFNVKETVDNFEAQLKKDQLSETQMKGIYQRFNQALNDAELDYAKETQTALIVTQASVKNIPDVTLKIQQLIEKKMRGQDHA